jgi:RNA polymerase sigma factor for flagellar operon FliA
LRRHAGGHFQYFCGPALASLPFAPWKEEAMQSVAGRNCNLSAAEREARVLRYLPQVKYIARRIHDRLPPQVPLADLVQAGVLGLLDAIERFDASRGVDFAAYARFRIRGAIVDSLREIDWSPRELRRKARLVEAATARLEQRLGRRAAEPEIAAAMELSLPAFRRLLAEIKGLDLFALDAESGAARPHAGGRDVADTRQEGAYQHCLRHEMHRQLTSAIARLPRQEQQVLALYYYEELTMKDIGKLLGVGESRVSQIHSMAVLTLRRRLPRSRAGTPSVHAVGKG